MADVDAFEGVQEFSAVDALDAVEVPQEEAQEVDESLPQSNRVFLVRVPRPPIDAADAQTKKLQLEFQTHLEKIKKLNGKLAAKRTEVRELRSQMAMARGLKETSAPEFNEKMERIKGLRALRKQHITRLQYIRGLLKGIKCRSEAELDNMIKELEHRIHYGQLPLREEREAVKEISALQAQRSQVKEYETHKAELTELEGEVSKIDAVISEIDSEFGILKGERDVASKIMNDFWTKLQAADAALKEVEEEQQDAVKAKNEAMEALQASREASDDTMKDFRDNRRFSLQVRDLVAAREVDQARALCVQQTEEMIARLVSDSAFRAEYYKLAAQNRKFAVSEVLPTSSAAAMAEAAKAKPQAKGAKGAAKPSEPQGKQKGEALIEMLMKQASKEAAMKSAAKIASQPRDDEEEEDVEETPVVKPSKPAPAAPKEPFKPVENPSAKAAEVFGYKVEMPKEPDFGVFEPPKIKDAPKEDSKDKVREDNRLKQQEAEQRKARRVELAEKKKAKAVLVAEIKKKEEEKRTAQSTAAQEKVVTRTPVTVEEEDLSDDQATPAPAAQPAAPVKQVQKTTPVLKAMQPGAAAKRRPEKASLDKKALKVWKQNQTPIAVGISVVALAIIFMLVAKM